MKTANLKFFICAIRRTAIPHKEKTIKYINYMLKVYEPDLVVLGGDNTVASKETKEDAIKELCTPFVENEVYFTLVFGNHDHEQGVSNEENLKYYQKYGGKYCLAYDEIPSMHGTATHNLPVYASSGDEIKFNVWLFDTGSYVYDENNPDTSVFKGHLLEPLTRLLQLTARLMQCSKEAM